MKNCDGCDAETIRNEYADKKDVFKECRHYRPVSSCRNLCRTKRPECDLPGSSGGCLPRRADKGHGILQFRRGFRSSRQLEATRANSGHREVGITWHLDEVLVTPRGDPRRYGTQAYESQSADEMRASTLSVNRRRIPLINSRSTAGHLHPVRSALPTATKAPSRPLQGSPSQPFPNTSQNGNPTADLPDFDCARMVIHRCSSAPCATRSPC